MAKDQRPPPRESTKTEPSWPFPSKSEQAAPFSMTAGKPKKPWLVPAFNDRSTPALSFSVPMPAFPATGPTRAAQSSDVVETAALSVDEKIANLKRQVAELHENLGRDEENTPARLEELYKLHELIGNVANRSTMAFSASVGGPVATDLPAASTALRSPSQSPPSGLLSPLESDHGDADEEALEPDAAVG